MNKVAVIAIPVLCLTAACGGSSTGTAQFGAVAAASQSFSDLVAISETYDQTFSATNPDDNRLSTAAELPSGGTARFDGVMVISPPRVAEPSADDFLAMGGTSVTVDFDAGTAAGTTGQFYQIDPTSATGLDSLDGAAIDGSVAYALTNQSDTVNIFLGDATGQLTDEDGGVVTIDVTVGGGVMGPDADGFRAGTLSDTATQVEVYALEQ